MAFSVSTSGASVNAYGLAASSDGSFSFDGAVDKVMGILDSKAPKFVQSIMKAAALAGAEVAAAETAFASAMAALPAEIGAEAAVLGPFVPIAAAFGAIVPILIALDPASGGAGCCGVSPKKQFVEVFGRKWPVPGGGRFGTCSPKEWDWYGPSGPGGHYGNQWAGDHWANTTGPGVQEWHSPNPWEEYIGQAIIAAFNQGTDCWHYFPLYAYPIALAAAIGAWNRTHSPDHVVTMPGGRKATLPPMPVYRVVNADVHVPAQSRGFSHPAYVLHGQPSDPVDPIAIALNYAAMNWDKSGKSHGFHVPANRTVSFKVNMGPAIAPKKGSIVDLPASIANLIPIGRVSFGPQVPPTPHLVPIVPGPIHMALGGKPPIPGGIEAAGGGGSAAPGMTIAGVSAKKIGIGAAVVGALAVGWHFFGK